MSRQRGIQRERDFKHRLEREGWLVFRAAGSLGCADLVAIRGRQFEEWASEVRLIEVKSTRSGPYHSFGPASRAALRVAARRAGASAWLVWWPPRARPVWIPETDWPAGRVAA